MALPLETDRITLFGVLNTTPDSFSDGGRFVDSGEHVDIGAASRAAEAMVRAGADLIDVGGESTRPGSEEVPVARELARTVPVIAAIAKHLDVPISIDTRKAAVAEAALDAGASLVNDVSGLRYDPELARVVARAGAGLVLGHLRGSPASMQRDPHFDDVLDEVGRDLARSVALAREAGVSDKALMVDPGIGFGKRLPDNLALLARSGALREALGLPVLIGASRKSFLGELTGEPVGERDSASHVAAAIAVFAGADALRVHDVSGARRAVVVALAMRRAREAAVS
ncbi:MAG: dihydropteroate synthase [Myxococcota bacterium]